MSRTTGRFTAVKNTYFIGKRRGGMSSMKYLEQCKIEQWETRDKTHDTPEAHDYIFWCWITHKKGSWLR